MNHGSATTLPAVDEAHVAQSAAESPALPPGWRMALDACLGAEQVESRLPDALTFEADPAHAAAFARFTKEVAEHEWQLVVANLRVEWERLPSTTREAETFEQYLVRYAFENEFLDIDYEDASRREAMEDKKRSMGDRAILEEFHRVHVRTNQEQWLKKLYEYLPAGFYRRGSASASTHVPPHAPGGPRPAPTVDSVGTRSPASPKPRTAPEPERMADSVLKCVTEYQKKHGRKRTRLTMNDVHGIVGGNRKTLREAVRLLLRDRRLFDENLGQTKQLAIRLWEDGDE